MDTLKRTGSPDRVYNIELKLDDEVQDALVEVFELLPEFSRADPSYELERHMAVQRFCGYDYVRAHLDDVRLSYHDERSEDTAALRAECGKRLTGWEYADLLCFIDEVQAHAAAMLGIGKSGLNQKIKKYNLDVGSKR